MPISNNKLRLIHVARRQLDISDAEYRSALVQLTGVTTSKDLDDDGFVALLGLFEHLGFSPLSAKGENYGDRKGMASFAQIELVRVLWSEFTRHSYPSQPCATDPFNTRLTAKYGTLPPTHTHLCRR